VSASLKWAIFDTFFANFEELRKVEVHDGVKVCIAPPRCLRRSGGRTETALAEPVTIIKVITMFMAMITTIVHLYSSCGYLRATCLNARRGGPDQGPTFIASGHLYSRSPQTLQRS
jgi:hypothetical protein